MHCNKNKRVAKKHLRNPKQTTNNKLNAAQQICGGDVPVPACRRSAGYRPQPPVRTRDAPFTADRARLRAGEGCATRLLNQKRKSAIARNDRALPISENEGDAARRQRE
jgi:hypothetical protein